MQLNYIWKYYPGALDEVLYTPHRPTLSNEKIWPL